MPRKSILLSVAAFIIAITALPASATRVGDGDLQFSCFKGIGYWSYTPDLGVRLFGISAVVLGESSGLSEDVARIYPGETGTVYGNTIRSFTDKRLVMEGSIVSSSGGYGFSVGARCQGRQSLPR
ncbi:hypothetical protein ACQ4M3_37215 [Leptolyngbya sp. AN03gr2]|uniref:hypothetical protein n=1 Tax=unclassified Leptolyngbya TaxID=2650499 RepID=UPI003D32189C